MAPRQEITLVSERTISGRGLIKLVPDVANRHFWLYTNVIRLPSINFDNQKYNPERSDYANIVWLRQGYVVREDKINYENQVFEWDVEAGSYIGSFAACAYSEIIGYLSYLAPFIPAPPLVIDPLDRLRVEPIYNVFDQIKIVCRSDTAILAKLYKLNYDVGCTDATPSPKEPPYPTIPERAPTGVAIGVSSPYDDPDDGGDTRPATGDELGGLEVSCTITFYYTDLYTPANSRVIESDTFLAQPPIVIGTVAYSNPGNLPVGSYRKSDVGITDAAGSLISINLINNSFNGHTVSDLSSGCE